MNHTMESWGRYWLEHHDKPNVRPSTYGAHRYLMENHIIPGLGKVPLAELTDEKVAVFLEEVRLHGNHRPESKEERVVKSGKPVVYGKRKRVVPLAHQTVKLLEAEHQKHPSNPWMFPHPGTGKPYSRTMIRRLHNKILEKAGIDHIRLEDLRHTFAIHSLQGGVKAKELSAILGHTRADFLVRSYQPYLRRKGAVRACRTDYGPAVDELERVAEILGKQLW